MDKKERAQRLKAMLSQIAPGDNIEAVQRPPREDGGLESVDLGPPPPEETGLQKLAQGDLDNLSDAEMFGLEAIIMPQNRPVVFVRGDSYDDVDEPWKSLNLPDVKARISPLLASIGRVEVPNVPNIPYAGTAFIVGKGLMMTNRHVARLFSSGIGLHVVYREGDAAVDFQRQIDAPDTGNAAYFKVRGVKMVHPYWDMSLIEVDGLPENRMLNLSITSPDDAVDHDVVVLGYPAKDWRSNLDVQDRIFENKYNVKRLQPGKVRPRMKVQSFENTVNAITHDASTLGGNSGSAVVDVKTGEVLALHFAGEYLKANYAVPMYEIARDSRVAPLLNFKASLTPTNDWEPSWLALESKADNMTPKTPIPRPTPDRVAAPIAPLQSPATGNVTANWTIPIHISISVGVPYQAGDVTSVAALVTTEPEEAVVVNQDYSDRQGYDPKFLDGVVVPLPKLSDAMLNDTAQVQPDQRKHGDPYELAYHHYSVYMNKKRRTAWFSAANVDGLQRPNIGSRSGDRWYSDPRIKKEEQLAQKAFEHGMDRGHLTRRDDTAWGPDIDSATAANNDTFHFTNCSLQASMFNRAKDRWQGLEQYLLEKHAKKDKRRMTVITGPVFAPNDPVYKNDSMDYSVRCPLQFWKVCVLVREDGSPSATAFILGQDEMKDLPGFEESFDVAATQIKIADLEKRTGLSFGDLNKHDHFAQGGGGLEAAAVDFKPIRGEADIVI